jgi:hypothetical protein
VRCGLGELTSSGDNEGLLWVSSALHCNHEECSRTEGSEGVDGQDDVDPDQVKGSGNQSDDRPKEDPHAVVDEAPTLPLLPRGRLGAVMSKRVGGERPRWRRYLPIR